MEITLDILRHSCSHIMAQAVKELWPDVKLAIGPSIENGFYYDFDKKEPFSDEDLKRIEAQMQKILDQNEAFVQMFMDRNEALGMFKEHKEPFKAEIIENLTDPKISLYKTGDDFVDLCKGPHVERAGQIKAFKLLSVAGAYWHGDETKPMLQRIYGTCFFSKKELDEHLHALANSWICSAPALSWAGGLSCGIRRAP
jgi:threonyl-tRNA synthetase